MRETTWMETLHNPYTVNILDLELSLYEGNYLNGNDTWY